MSRLKKVWELFKKAGKGMSDDQAPMMGAAVAYYTMFSIAPLLIIAIGVAGVVFGESANVRVFGAIKDMVGPQGASAIQSMVKAAASRPHAGMVATIVGIVTLIAGASGVFTQLQQSLNIIWKVATHPKAGWGKLVRQRLLSFGMVAVIGFVLLVSMVVSAGLSAAGQWAGGALPGGQAVWRVLNFLISLAVIGALICAVLKLLPDVRLTWRDVRLGGLVTAVLFVLGKEGIGAYIGRSGTASSYGAAGSLIVILLWVYYSSQILFFGAEFTRAWATRDGRKVAPKEGAIYTLPPTASASMAEKLAEGSTNPVAEKALEQARTAWYAAAAASAAAGAAALARRKQGRGRVLLGGLAEGVALGVLAVLVGPQLMGRGKPRQERPSAASKLIAKIPARVKAATLVGALKGGGREAGRELQRKLRPG